MNDEGPERDQDIAGGKSNFSGWIQRRILSCLR